MTILKLGIHGEDVKKLQFGLNKLGFNAGIPDGIFGIKTEDAVEDFQEKYDLYADGIVGNVTAKYFDNALANIAPQYRLLWNLPAVSHGNQQTANLISVQCDKLGSSGYTTMRMREDVAERYNRLRDQCLLLGGGVTSAGCTRPLGVGGSASQSATSLHYCGIAWDLSLDSGMNKLDNPYIVTDMGDRKWNVWMKCAKGAVPSITLPAVICKTSNGITHLSSTNVTGHYINFTDLAAQHGFRPIRGRKSFFNGGTYLGAEWWHFQCEEVLIPHQSTFGGELLKLYSESTIKNNFKGNWQLVKDCIWKDSWF